MEVEPVGTVPSPRRSVQPIGATAELAETRTKLRHAVAPERWDAVQAEVHRLQFGQGMSPLAALQAVYAKLASGWAPPPTR
jgi:hypothetical protein